MNIKTGLLALTGSPLFQLTAISQDTNFFVFFCFGQSNMESGGRMEEMDRTVDRRFQVLADLDASNRGRKKGQWYDAVPPLAAKGSGICLVDYFGRTMVSNLPQNIRVGVVKVSVPGCKIELFERDTYTNYAVTAQSWMKNLVKAYDGNTYQYLVDLAKQARRMVLSRGFCCIRANQIRTTRNGRTK